MMAEHTRRPSAPNDVRKSAEIGQRAATDAARKSVVGLVLGRHGAEPPKTSRWCLPRYIG